jgi:3-hydroxymyristoyl/3-hydroxydecanoyl-(acyl carrier protein) dehydratase
MTIVDPKVVRESVEGSTARIELVVPPELEYFDGHFPGVPIVPGVVQLKWAIDGARRCLGLSGAVARIEALKFRDAIGPGAQAALTLRYAAETAKLHFSFDSEERRHSSGRIVFASFTSSQHGSSAC